MKTRKRSGGQSESSPTAGSPSSRPVAAPRPNRRKTQRTSRRADESAEGVFPIVGIGASAGGFDALRRLLEAMPDKPGVALVIIQHLDPTKKSLASELLAKSTRMQVCQVEDDPQVKPNHVYVIPPGKYLSIAQGKLHLSEPDAPRGARMAIDVFLRSLAADQTVRAVGVILSGSGTDGTLGVKAIKAAGGIVVAQDPLTAEFDTMPHGAIETGAVDHVLPPEEIPEVLVRYAQHPYVREEGATPVLEREAETAALQPDGLNAILALLKAHTRRDFRSFKEKMVIRRTRRRMCLYHIDDYGVYLKYVREHPREIDALARDLLISVTDFFRDPDAWQALGRLAVRPIVEAKPADVPIRVWTAGCATGEEPYSLAMLFLEELRRAEKTCPLQVFASDIDQAALEHARISRYPKTIQGDVAPERLKRFFTPVDGDDYYRVNKMLRDSVLFAEHDLISDPPFSKLDLICCRNLLIYLKPKMQERIIALFHFALNEGGVLFLGSAETVGRQTDLFGTLDKRWRIFRRLGATRRDRVEIPLTTFGGRRDGEAVRAEPLRRETRLAHLAQGRLLELLSPNAVLIDRQWRMHYISGDVDPYLTHKPGVPSDNLLESARLGLRTKLRSAVHTAFTEKRSVSLAARVQRMRSLVPITITVHVVQDHDRQEDLALVVFAERAADRSGGPQVEQAAQETSPGKGAVAGEAAPPGPQRTPETDFDADAVVRQLEEELAHVRYDLQATIQQLETSNEEYRAANEEVMSINEELQSTNEELETSKEELQSLNEELSTVNSELAAKVEELESKHADLENLVAATDMATICLDTELAIRWFTPAAQHVVRLKPADMGRPLFHLADDFADSDLVPLAQRVLESLTPVEDEVTCRDGRTFLRRITPYRAENRIGGVVITFIDISSRRTSEQSLRASEERLQAILNAATDAIVTINHSGLITGVNPATERMFGY
ncbi:MAG TPA: chemotaxis protein CheB, partial [Planctomycetaceae bacterium]|nr:chemotaxis protein CheB [Planctomycetaceae bacterium]